MWQEWFNDLWLFICLIGVQFIKTNKQKKPTIKQQQKYTHKKSLKSLLSSPCVHKQRQNLQREA